MLIDNAIKYTKSTGESDDISIVLRLEKGVDDKSYTLTTLVIHRGVGLQSSDIDFINQRLNVGG